MKTLAGAAVLLAVATSALAAPGGTVVLKTPKAQHHLRLGRPLGSGAWGRVVEAEVVSSGGAVPDRVALKIRTSADPKQPTGDTLDREWAIMQRVGGKHPSLLRSFGAVGLLDSGERAFMMQLAPGQPVHAPQDTGTAIALTRQILHGAQKLHEAGLYHGDFQPPNVHDDGKQVYIVDYGRTLGIEEPREVVGHSGYQAPEEVQPGGGVTKDVYRIAGVLVFMLTQQPPASVNVATDARIANDLRPILQKALSSNPSDRYPSARAFDQALERLQNRSDEYRSKRRQP